MNGRNGQLSRIICLISVLDQHPTGMTVSEMKDALKARGFRVSGRTVYRDIDALDAGGLPLFLSENRNDGDTNRWCFPHRLKVIQRMRGN